MKIFSLLITVSLPVFAWGIADGNTGATLQPQKMASEELLPVENLMRDHGVHNRLLLIYNEFIRRLDAKERFSPELLKQTALILKNYIADYHEKLESDYVFPVFEEKGVMVELVKILRDQNEKGRALTDYILNQATQYGLNDAGQQNKIREVLREYVVMYLPHEAFEDTVLFPKFKTFLNLQEYEALGNTFVKKEQELFGDGGYEKVINDVSEIEKKLGIHELSKFTSQIFFN